MSFQGGKFSVEDRVTELRLAADVCIVGAGAGGSAAALALAEAGLTVVVLEEGRHWAPKDFQQKMPWALRNLYAERGIRTAMGETIIPVAAGRGVGGSTLINSAISFRPPAERIALWRDQAGFDQEHKLSALVDRVWKDIGVNRMGEK